MNISNTKGINTTTNWYTFSTISLMFILSFLCLKNKVNNFLNNLLNNLLRRREIRNNINENNISEVDDYYNDDTNEILEDKKDNKENDEEDIPPSYNEICKL